MMQPRLKHFGWGREGEGLTSAEETFVFERVEQRFGPLADSEIKPPRLEDLKIETPRLNPPASLPFCSAALYDRAAHTYGKSFPDYVRGLSAITAAHRMWSPIRAPRRRSQHCSIGRAAPRPA